MRDHCQRWQRLAFSKGDNGEARTTRWGFVRFWAKDQAIGNKIINARSETLADRPPFKDLLSSRRYLVPADGFYA